MKMGNKTAVISTVQPGFWLTTYHETWLWAEFVKVAQVYMSMWRAG